MLRNREFYHERYGWSNNRITELYDVMERSLKGDYDSNFIRNNNADMLRICICEGEIELLCKLVSPVMYIDSNVMRYHYLIDLFTLDSQNIFSEFIPSISEYWAEINKKAREEALSEGREYHVIPVGAVIKDIVILPDYVKSKILEAAYHVDYDKIKTIKIKEVLARQVSGMGHPIRSKKDVVYYAEASTLKACLDLYEKNIITVANDTENCYSDYSKKSDGAVVINIDYQSLDTHNKNVIDELVNMGIADISWYNRTWANIRVKCDVNETIEEVNDRLMPLIAKFHKQDMIYGRISRENVMEYLNKSLMLNFTKEKRSEIASMLATCKKDEDVAYVMYLYPYNSFYYDDKEKQFWMGKYYYDKHQEYLMEQKVNNMN